jgi:hypothetical protein
MLIFINHLFQVITMKGMKVWSFITKTHSGYNIYGTLIIIIKKKEVNNIKWYTCINYPFCYSKITPFNCFCIFQATLEIMFSTMSCFWHEICLYYCSFFLFSRTCSQLFRFKTFLDGNIFFLPLTSTLTLLPSSLFSSSSNYLIILSLFFICDALYRLKSTCISLKF